ncbi:MAG: hypothetical protein ABI859_14090 [Pseudomonadota bacterium]
MRSLLATALLLIAGVAAAQEGFPLDGTWRAERQAAGNTAVTLVLVLEWDGKKVSGILNPGPKAVTLQDVQLIPDGWKVTLTATDAAGKPLSFEGVIGELGAYHRYMEGTWKEGGRDYKVRFVHE